MTWIDKKRTVLRLTHRALIESCELRQGEFLIAPISAHRRGDKRPHCLQPWSCDSTSGHCQMKRKRKRARNNLLVLGPEQSPIVWLKMGRKKNPRSTIVAPANLFVSSWRPPVEQVKLGKDSYCFCLLSAGFCVRYCALVLCSGGGGGSASGTADGSRKAFVLLLKILRFSSFWRSSNAALIIFWLLVLEWLIVSHSGKRKVGAASVRLKDFQKGAGWGEPASTSSDFDLVPASEEQSLNLTWTPDLSRDYRYIFKKKKGKDGDETWPTSIFPQII